VILTRDVGEHGLCAGDVGTLMAVSCGDRLLNPSGHSLDSDLGEIRPYRFVLSVALQRFGPLLTAVPAHLESAKWRVRMVLVPRVEPHGARFDSVRQPQRPTHVTGLDAGRQTVTAVVREPDRFIFTVERDDWDDRPEDLFARDPHVVRRICKHGGLDEQPFAVDLLRLAAGDDLGALALPDLDVADDLVVLRFARDRPNLRCAVERIAEDCGVRAFGEAIDERVVDRSPDEDTGASRADLALVPEDSSECCLDGIVKIRVRENDVR
jgi:hypothetical protein